MVVVNVRHANWQPVSSTATTVWVCLCASIPKVTMYAGEPPPEAFSRWLKEETDGNPFFLGALIAHLADSGMPSNAWKKAMASPSTSPPTTFETVRRNAWAATPTARR